MSEHIKEVIMNGRAIDQLDDKNDRFPSNLSIQLRSLSPQSLLLQPFLSPTDKSHLLLHKEVISQMSSLHKFFDTLAYQATTETQGQEFCGKLLQLKENIRVVHGNRLAKVLDMIREIERQEGMATDRNEYSARMATTRLKQTVHDEVREASYAWKTLDAVQKMEIQDPTLRQFGLPESSVKDIKEITVDVSCLLHNKETVTSFGKLLTRAASGLLRLNLVSGRADHASLENNKLANNLGAVLRQATSTSTSLEYLRLSHIEDTVLYNMTSRQKSIRTFQPNKLVRWLCFHGKPTQRAVWIYWLMPWGKTHPVSMLQELVLEHVNLSFDISAVGLLNFLLDHQPSLRKLTLRHCRVNGGLRRYLALLLQDKVDLVEDITMTGIQFLPYKCCCHGGGNDNLHCHNKRMLDETLQRIQKTKKKKQRQLLQNKDCSSNKNKSTVSSSKPNKSLNRVVIRDMTSSWNAVSDLCASLGDNSSVTDLTLWSQDQSRTGDFRALLQGNGNCNGISTGMETVERGATVIHRCHSMISSLQFLDIGGERTQEWIDELTMLVSNPQSVLKCLTVRLGCVNNGRLRTREYRSNPNGTSALANYFAGLQYLVKNGLQGHSTLAKLAFVSNRSYENVELLTELSILLKAFTHPLVTLDTARGRLRSFRYEVQGIYETDPELLDIFRDHFCPPHSEEENRESMLQYIQIGSVSDPRSLGIQYHALRVLIQNTLRQALWGCPSDGHRPSSSSSLWPIVLGGLLTWRDNPVTQSMCPKECEQLYLSGIFWSILESPCRMIMELEASDTVWKKEQDAELCPNENSIMDDVSKTAKAISSCYNVNVVKPMEDDSNDGVDVDGYEYRKFWYTHSPF